VIRRTFAVVFAAALLIPAAAHASVTRAIQSVSGATSLFWSPNKLNAQQGDTIQWRMTEPGNPNAATHDLWLIKPGADPSTAVQLGATYLGDGTAHAVVDQVGTYTFYCSIHGGLSAGGMNGTVTVGTTDPGPPVDPGQPWNNPGGGDDGNGFPNPTTAPTVFEEGDNTPPALTLTSMAVKRHALKLVLENTDGIQIAYTVKHKKKLTSSGSQAATPGQNTLKVKLPDKPNDYTVNVWSIDDVDLESDPPVAVTIVVHGATAKMSSAPRTP
jgi:plastocyanin